MIPNLAIKNLRYGVATNSSSTHSIIHNAVRTFNDNEVPVEDDHYGWQYFTLASKEEKEKYLLKQLLANIPYESRISIKAFLEMSGFKEASNSLYSVGIDHQSVMNFPKTKLKSIDLDFFNEYFDYIVNNNFIILGGNDNDDSPHSLANEHDGRNPHWDVFYSDDVSFKNGNYWVVFNPARKMRISFNEEPLEPIFPELIDMKITDFCAKGCNYCFVGGTRINTPSGFVDIDNLKIGDKVFAFDEKKEKLITNTVDQLFERDFQGDLIIKAGDLTKEDELYGFEDM